MIVVDTSAILAYTAADAHLAAVSAWLEVEPDELATTPLIVAEAGHLAAARDGPVALRALRRGPCDGRVPSNGGPER